MSSSLKVFLPHFISSLPANTRMRTEMEILVSHIGISPGRGGTQVVMSKIVQKYGLHLCMLMVVHIVDATRYVSVTGYEK